MHHYLTDTHSHIYSEEFAKDRRDIVFNAHKAGIKKILLPNIDSNSIEPMLKLCKQFPHNIFPMMGLHPTSVEDDYESELQIVEDWLDKEKFYAVGEIGIDLHWDKTFVDEQIIAFGKQIDFALKHKLPIVIHARKAFDEIFKVLDEKWTPELTGVFHSFSGSLEQAQTITKKYNFYLGINGVVTFKNTKLPTVLKEIDSKYILLETDAPYLSPEPKRGKRNESAFMFYTARKVAEIYELDIKAISEITTQNAINLFKFPHNAD